MRRVESKPKECVWWHKPFIKSRVDGPQMIQPNLIGGELRFENNYVHECFYCNKYWIENANDKYRKASK